LNLRARFFERVSCLCQKMNMRRSPSTLLITYGDSGIGHADCLADCLQYQKFCNVHNFLLFFQSLPFVQPPTCSFFLVLVLLIYGRPFWLPALSTASKALRSNRKISVSAE
jgi:hypothetical protein